MQSISGVISIPSAYIQSNPSSSTLFIHLYELNQGQNVPTVSQLFKFTPLKTISLSNYSTNQVYEFDGLNSNNVYFVFASIQPHSEPKLFRPYGTVQYNNIAGWYSNEDSGWLTGIQFTNGIQQNINFQLLGNRPFILRSKSDVKVNGVLRDVKGYPVLNLWGNPKQRGYAQGYLIAEQILDFFQFFIVESTVESSKLYKNHYEPLFIKSLARDPDAMFAVPDVFLDEIHAIVQGMIDSGVDIYMPYLHRNFSAIDILAINAYIEIEFIQTELSEGAQNKMAACSQFSLWNTQTQNNPKLRGNIIAGRNMDGELDIRRVTVTHFLTFAVDPNTNHNGSLKRYVSMMWPGFIGTLTGVNEDGLYNMMNYGTSSSDKAQFIHATPVTFIVQNLLSEQANVPLDQFTADAALKQINTFNSKTGGACVTGCVLFFAKPYRLGSNEIPSFVFEGDWVNGMMRLPTQAQPTYINDTILATNHFHVYGVDPKTHDSHVNFGKQVYFNTLARYDRGSARIESYTRTPTVRGKMGFNEIESALQIVAAGTTEHSVIYRMENNIVTIAVTIAEPFNMKTAWDAPYLTWTEFQFEELFNI
jgi:hypothetical protein